MKRNKKEVQEFDQFIYDHIVAKNLVKIDRDCNEGISSIGGFLLEASKNLLMLQKEEDFRLDGYSIIPQDQYISIEHSKFDKAIKKILSKEGILKSQYGVKHAVDLTDWKSVFHSLKDLDLHVIVECENCKDTVFLIGPIKKIGKKSVEILFYNAMGELETKPTSVQYKDISIVSFDNNYLNVFRKYLKTPKKK